MSSACGRCGTLFDGFGGRALLEGEDRDIRTRLYVISAGLSEEAHAHARQQVFSLAHEAWCKKRGVDLAIATIEQCLNEANLTACP